MSQQYKFMWLEVQLGHFITSDSVRDESVGPSSQRWFEFYPLGAHGAQIRRCNERELGETEDKMQC